MTFIIDIQPTDMVENIDQDELWMFLDENDYKYFTNNRIHVIRFLPNGDENQEVRYYWTGEEYTRRLVDDDQPHILKESFSNVGKLWSDEEIEGLTQLFV